MPTKIKGSYGGYQVLFDIRRRFKLIQEVAFPTSGKVLDLGFGEGRFFEELSKNYELFGLELHHGKAHNARKLNFSGIILGDAETTPFKPSIFDFILSNEMLEHVHNDRKVVEKACECLKEGGYLAVFVPNRFFPFESHGCFFGKTRVGFFGFLVPFVNYFPSALRNKIAPHVGTYTMNQLYRLFKGLPVEIIHCSYMYPAFEALERVLPLSIVNGIRMILPKLEKTPLKVFGGSLFVIVRKNSKIRSKITTNK